MKRIIDRLLGCTPRQIQKRRKEQALREEIRRETFAEVSIAMNRVADIWERDGSDPCRVRVLREHANAYRTYAEGLGEPTGSRRGKKQG